MPILPHFALAPRPSTHISDKDGMYCSPVSVVPDPIRGEDNVLVLCEVFYPDGTPHETNTRAKLEALINDKVRKEAPLFGFEQASLCQHSFACHCTMHHNMCVCLQYCLIVTYGTYVTYVCYKCMLLNVCHCLLGFRWCHCFCHVSSIGQLKSVMWTLHWQLHQVS